MTTLYQSVYRNSAKYEAQYQLTGRSHYVDDETLRFHHARVLSADIHADGKLFWLIESVSLDMRNTMRGFRYVVFDIFGNIISRVDLKHAFKTSKQARKALKAYLETVDADAVTIAGIKQFKKNNETSLFYLEEQLKRITK